MLISVNSYLWSVETVNYKMCSVEKLYHELCVFNFSSLSRIDQIYVLIVWGFCLFNVFVRRWLSTRVWFTNSILISIIEWHRFVLFLLMEFVRQCYSSWSVFAGTGMLLSMFCNYVIFSSGRMLLWEMSLPGLTNWEWYISQLAKW